MYIDRELKEKFWMAGVILIMLIGLLIGCYVQKHDTLKCYWNGEVFVQEKTERILNYNSKKDLTKGYYYVTIDNNNTTEVFEDDTIIKVVKEAQK
jgi:hypothetical protein